MEASTPKSPADTISKSKHHRFRMKNARRRVAQRMSALEHKKAATSKLTSRPPRPSTKESHKRSSKRVSRRPVDDIPQRSEESPEFSDEDSNSPLRQPFREDEQYSISSEEDPRKDDEQVQLARREMHLQRDRATALRHAERHIRDQLAQQAVSARHSVLEAREERAAALRVARADVDALRRTVGALEAERGQLVADVERMRMEGEAKVSELGTALGQERSALAKEKEKAQALEREKEQFRLEVVQQKIEISAATKAIEGNEHALQQQNLQMQSLQQQLEQAKTAAMQAEQQIKPLQDALTTSRADYEKATLLQETAIQAKNDAEEHGRTLSRELEKERSAHVRKLETLREEMHELRSKCQSAGLEARQSLADNEVLSARAKEAESALAESRAQTAQALQAAQQTQAEISTMGDRLEEVQQQAERHASRSARAETELAASRSELNAVERRLQAKEGQLDNQVTLHETQYKELRRQYETLQVQNEKQAQRLKEQHDLTMRAAEEIKGAEERVKELQTQRNAARKERDALRTRNEHLVEQHESYDRDVGAMESKIQQVKKKYEKELEAKEQQSKILTTKHEKAQKKLLSLEQLVPELEKQRDEQIRQIGELENEMHLMRDQYEGEVEAVVEDNDELQDKLESVTTQLKEQQTQVTQQTQLVDKLRVSNTSYKRRLAELKKRSVALRNSYEEVTSRLEGDVDFHSRRADELEVALRESRAEIVELEGHRQRVGEYAHDVVKMQELVKTLQAEFSAETAALEERCDAQARELQSAREQLQQAEHREVAFREEQQHVGNEVAQLEDEIETLQSRYEEGTTVANVRLTRAAEELNKERVLRKETEHQLEQLTKRCEAYALEIKSLEENAAALQSEHDTDVAKVGQEVEGKIAEERARWQRMMHRQSELMQEKEKAFEKALQESGERRDEMEEEVEELRSLYSREIASVLDQLAHAEDQQESRHDGVRSRLQQVTSTMRTNSEELDILRQTVTAVQREMVRIMGMEVEDQGVSRRQQEAQRLAASFQEDGL